MAEVIIYFERQSGAACGVHCLNNLLQGAYFDEITLAETARELDQQQQQLFNKVVEFSNVLDNGYYSAQTLFAALESLSFTCTPLGNTTSTFDSELADAGALLCHNEDHWFALRKFGNHWIDLNSFNKQPKYLTDFYFSSLVQSLKSQSALIFIVNGDFNNINPSDSPKIIRGSFVQVAITTRPQNYRANDDELAAAIQLSLASTQSTQTPQNLGNELDDDLETAIAISLSMNEQNKS
eukprot:TRINITY_DN1377_c0_g1_i1.p1 TRINITY_DN1377_c0_g1~~TRINITY_DN1377_c0_g1_i1.p1  ORF type:complete len:238 (+),score=117.18 TRINITY_DN1377_c0_g1_i1:88-801(+)